MQPLFILNLSQWEEAANPGDSVAITQKLESGQVIFCPNLKFILSEDELSLLNPAYSNGRAKNISYHLSTNTLRGALADTATKNYLKKLLKRYAINTTTFIKSLFPAYANALHTGRTSLRLIEIAGRSTLSYKKDDTRLHVDAFPANPNQGKRILRIFTNINPDSKPRAWRIGEPFTDVAQQFLPKVPVFLPGLNYLLKMFAITKSLRTPYDHAMLHIHNQMKGDEHYQSKVKAFAIDFPAGSSWIVFTDQVSHAAMSGQHLLEQTFYLPINAMQDEKTSPLRVLESLSGKLLV